MRARPRPGHMTFRQQRLALYGSIWVLLGIATTVQPIPHHAGLTGVVIDELIPPWIRGAAWVLTGGTAVVTALRRAHDDSKAWAALIAMPTLRMLSFATSFALWAATRIIDALITPDLPRLGYAPGLTAATIYLAIDVLIWSSSRHRCETTARLGDLPDPPACLSRGDGDRP